jgi:translation initiation factor IF-1
MRGVGFVLLLGLVLAPALGAHEGHTHKVMGTVSAIHENHLEVKATDGKAVAVTLNDKTSIVREKARLAATDIKVGDRVVIAATQSKDKDGKVELVATQVKLGTAAK